MHLIAQVCHASAQNKIGSGFDVASCIYGSGCYRRFKPDRLSAVADMIENHTSSPSVVDTSLSMSMPSPMPCSMSSMSSSLSSSLPMSVSMSVPVSVSVSVSVSVPVSSFLSPSLRLDFLFSPWSLLGGVRMVLGDVDGGSATPALVSSVLKWKQTHAEAERIFKDLHAANEAFQTGLDGLGELSRISSTDYTTLLKRYSTRAIAELRGVEDALGLAPLLIRIRDTFLRVRTYLCSIGGGEIPVEPAEQTSLLDLTMEVEGVICAGVPGAGGYDAIFALTIGSLEPLEQMWESHNVCALPLSETVYRGIEISRT
eukprot:GILK01005178.1.p1 GENE.GILK01005178.1~~GILK01005178.1.p1  ORF type:complete len:314 (+),score=43.35 GILK01005178.1:239-1180(+)